MNTLSLRIAAITGCFAIVLTLAFDAPAQREKKEPDKSPGATVSQIVGKDSHITITYHRPGVKGREDKVFGTNLAPYGGKVWRAGANENTIIEFENDVKIEGKELAAGTYGFHIIASESEWILAFNKSSTGWGSFAYKEADDALRVTVKPEAAPHQEWLIYTFEDLSAEAVTIQLRWESKQVRFKVELDDPSA